MQNVVKPRSRCARDRGERGLERRRAVVVGEDGAHAADELELREVAARRRAGLRAAAPGPLGRLTERVEAVGVADDPPQEARVHRLAAEPQRAGRPGRHAFGSK